MTNDDSALLRQQGTADSPNHQVTRTSTRCSRGLKTAKFTLTLLVILTAGYITSLVAKTVSFDQTIFLPSPFRNLSGPSFIPSRNLPKMPDDGVDDSEFLQAFVKTKNFSSVSKYLESVRSYLRSFRSAMIAENRSQYSWAETDAERKRVSKTKRIVWFNAPAHVANIVKKHQFAHCPVKDCVVSINYKRDHAGADAVVFAGGSVAVPPRERADQIYVFYTLESPLFTSAATGGNFLCVKFRLLSLGRACRCSAAPPIIARWVFSCFRNPPNADMDYGIFNAFNWTWTYRTDSDIVEVYERLKRSPSVPSPTTLLAMKNRKKKRVAWMVSHCSVPSHRAEYVERLRKIIPVDIYGGCGNLSCPIWTRQCDLLLNDYLFYLSFENSLCVDYITEKFYKTFHDDVHVVGVVRGGANYSRYFPAGTFIDADAFSGPEKLGRYLLELAGDDGGYVDLLWRRSHFVTHDEGHMDAHCQVCYKLQHVDRFKRTYSDMYGWYHKHGCFTPKPF